MATSIDAIQLTIEHEASNAVKGLDALISKLNELQSTIRNMGGFQHLTQQLEKFSAAAEKVRTTGRGSGKASAENITGDMRSNARAFAAGTTKEEILEAKKDSITTRLASELNKDDYNQDKVYSLVQQLEKVNEAYNKITSAAQEAAQAAEQVPQAAGSEQTVSVLDNIKEQFSVIGAVSKDSFTRVASGIKDVLSPVTSFVGRIGKMLRMRLIRSITSGLREGVKSLYNYSKSINGVFAQAMDSISSAGLTMKNSIAVAVAPAIQALVPVLTNVVSWINSACNALSQFFALISGKSTWTKATTAVEEYGNAVKGAGGGAAEALASFDELNVISQGGGGGGGGASTDYGEMFEESAFFSPEIKEFVSWIEEHMQIIKDLALGVGAAILTWKLTGSTGLALEVGSVIVSYNAGKNIGYTIGMGKEVSRDEWLELIAGGLSGVAGGVMLGSKFGIKGAVIGGAIGLAISVSSAIVGVNEGLKAAWIAGIYGDVSLDAEGQLQLVNSLFEQVATINIEDVKATVSNVKTARKNVNDALDKMGGVLSRIDIIVKQSSLNVQGATAAITEKLNKTGAVLNTITVSGSSANVTKAIGEISGSLDAAGAKLTRISVEGKTADVTNAINSITGALNEKGAALSKISVFGTDVNVNSAINSISEKLSETGAVLSKINVIPKGLAVNAALGSVENLMNNTGVTLRKIVVEGTEALFENALSTIESNMNIDGVRLHNVIVDVSNLDVTKEIGVVVTKLNEKALPITNIDIEALPDEINSAVDELIDAMNVYCKSQKEVVNLSASMFKITGVDEAGNVIDITSNVMQNTIAGWDAVTEWFKMMGAKISDAIAEGIDENSASIVTQLMETMSEVATEVSMAKEMQKLAGEFKLHSLEQETFTGVSNLYNENIADYRKKTEELVTEQVAGWAGLARFYELSAKDMTQSEEDRNEAAKMAEYFNTLVNSTDIRAVVDRYVSQYEETIRPLFEEARDEFLKRGIQKLTYQTNWKISKQYADGMFNESPKEFDNFFQYLALVSAKQNKHGFILTGQGVAEAYDTDFGVIDYGLWSDFNASDESLDIIGKGIYGYMSEKDKKQAYAAYAKKTSTDVEQVRKEAEEAVDEELAVILEEVKTLEESSGMKFTEDEMEVIKKEKFIPEYIYSTKPEGVEIQNLYGEYMDNVFKETGSKQMYDWMEYMGYNLDDYKMTIKGLGYMQDIWANQSKGLNADDLWTELANELGEDYTGIIKKYFSIMQTFGMMDKYEYMPMDWFTHSKINKPDNILAEIASAGMTDVAMSRPEDLTRYTMQTQQAVEDAVRDSDILVTIDEASTGAITVAIDNAAAEQNSLLQTQNSLLSKILAKNTNVYISPSAILGRVVTKSQEQYSRATGV